MNVGCLITNFQGVIETPLVRYVVQNTLVGRGLSYYDQVARKDEVIMRGRVDGESFENPGIDGLNKICSPTNVLTLVNQPYNSLYIKKNLCRESFTLREYMPKNKNKNTRNKKNQTKLELLHCYGLEKVIYRMSKLSFLVLFRVYLLTIMKCAQNLTTEHPTPWQFMPFHPSAHWFPLHLPVSVSHDAPSAQWHVCLQSAPNVPSLQANIIVRMFFYYYYYYYYYYY